MNYIKQLDSIRTFAVLAVIICHWGSSSINKLFPFGNLGVNIFFVLSGFLITRILLLEKEKIEDNVVSYSKLTAVGKFMMRRVLRIFPIYYMMLLVLYFGAKFLPNPIPNDWTYYVFYTQNFLYYFRHAWPGGKVGPFWTLAVEEQFYLIWPWVLFFINKKYIKTAIISGIIIGIVSTFLFSLDPIRGEYSMVLTIVCLHSFCLGGLLSYWSISKNAVLETYYSKLKWIGIATFAVYIYVMFFDKSFTILERLLESILTVWLIASILLKKTSKFDFILNNRILISIGKVSYGIYVFHNFIPISISSLFHLLNKKLSANSAILTTINSIQDNTYAFNILCMSVLLAVAYASFYWFETPFLKLKKYF